MSRPSPFAVSLTATQRRVLEAKVRKRTFRNLGRACGRRRGLHAAGLVMACTFGR